MAERWHQHQQEECKDAGGRLTELVSAENCWRCGLVQDASSFATCYALKCSFCCPDMSCSWRCQLRMAQTMFLGTFGLLTLAVTAAWLDSYYHYPSLSFETPWGTHVVRYREGLIALRHVEHQGLLPTSGTRLGNRWRSSSPADRFSRRFRFRLSAPRAKPPATVRFASTKFVRSMWRRMTRCSGNFFKATFHAKHK